MYAVELEGHNDGVPYEKGRYLGLDQATRELGNFKEENPRVRWRLIKIIEDFA